MRIHALLHSPLGGDIYLPHWAASRGHRWTSCLVPEAEVLPGPEVVDGLVVLGGPMSVWDEDRHPWLVREKQLLRRFVEADRPVLGICLGAQLLAEVLGARAYRGTRQEIGWFPVQAGSGCRSHPLGAVLPDRFETFLWHGDTFDLPTGATHLAASAAFPNQAFAWRRFLALQFHLEVRPDWVRRLVQRDADQLQEAEFVQSAATVLARPEALYQVNNALMERLLDLWLAGPFNPGVTVRNR